MLGPIWLHRRVQPHRTMVRQRPPRHRPGPRDRHDRELSQCIALEFIDELPRDTTRIEKPGLHEPSLLATMRTLFIVLITLSTVLSVTAQSGLPAGAQSTHPKNLSDSALLDRKSTRLN